MSLSDLHVSQCRLHLRTRGRGKRGEEKKTKLNMVVIMISSGSADKLRKTSFVGGPVFNPFSRLFRAIRSGKEDTYRVIQKTVAMPVMSW